jgi:general secretion pathway protein G
MRTTHRNGRAGFSLVEMMVVIVILGLLATLVVPNVMGRFNAATVEKARADIVTIVNALKEYGIRNGGRVPETLEPLVMPDVNGETYLDDRALPVDPWGNEFVYEPPTAGESRPHVVSHGRDGQPGGEGVDGDIDSWTLREHR